MFGEQIFAQLRTGCRGTKSRSVSVNQTVFKREQSRSGMEPMSDCMLTGSLGSL